MVDIDSSVAYCNYAWAAVDAAMAATVVLVMDNSPSRVVHAPLRHFDLPVCFALAVLFGSEGVVVH